MGLDQKEVVAIIATAISFTCVYLAFRKAYNTRSRLWLAIAGLCLWVPPYFLWKAGFILFALTSAISGGWLIIAAFKRRK